MERTTTRKWIFNVEENKKKETRKEQEQYTTNEIKRRRTTQNRYIDNWNEINKKQKEKQIS